MKRSKLSDDETRGLFDTEPDKGRDEKEYAERYGHPTTYRLPKDLSEDVKRIADREHVGISELVEFILSRFVRRYEAGEIDLPKAEKEVKYTLENTG
jgi:predicted DNA-binding ribbon-helix-helix protein